MDDDPAVSRRQFFRGLAGDVLKAVGEVTGLAEDRPEPPPVVNFNEGDVVVPPEVQQATLNDLFGFLEQLGARQEEEQAADAAPEPPAESQPASGAHSEPEPSQA
jgi:hypothetical protein